MSLPSSAAPVARLRGVGQRYGRTVALADIDLEVAAGRMVGLIGPDGVGKSILLALVAGARAVQQGTVEVLGGDMGKSRHRSRVCPRIAYMPQGLGKNLYPTLSVEENLQFFGRLFGHNAAERRRRIDELTRSTGLHPFLARLAGKLSGGMKQKLALCCALIHDPDLLILDEPTSGVDPMARDNFWRLMVELARRDKVTIFISTHFMNEAERCDRISLMHAGRVLESAAPRDIMAQRGAATLEEAFIGYLEDAAGTAQAPVLVEASAPAALSPECAPNAPTWPTLLRQSLARIHSTQWREALELRRDPVRGAMALLGSLILMFVMGYGISMDVENLRFAVLDRDQTALSRAYTLNLAGSRYFTEQPPITTYTELDARMRSAEISLALEIPPGFARDVARGQPVQIGAWVDGAMPQRAETVIGYAQGLHQQWLVEQSRSRTGTVPRGLLEVEPRYRYNPDVRSLPSMVPAVIPLLLLMLPAMLTALAVVREKELGSIINLYVTPTTRTEFMLGKQMPYVLLALLNFGLMCLAAVTVFGVPITGSFATLTLGAVLFSLCSTGMGLLASTVTRSQIAAMFFAMVGTLIPAVQFAGLINPVSSMTGFARWVGEVYPASHMFTISRGVFNKALGLQDLQAEFWPMLVAVPVIVGAAILLLRKQES